MSIRISRGSRGAAVALAALAVIAGGSAAIASASSTPRGETYAPAIGINVPNGKLRIMEHSDPRFLDPPTAIHKAIGKLRTTPVTGIPGRFLPEMLQTPFPPQLLTVGRAWQTSNGRTFVAVYVGVNPADSSQGRIVIFRQDIMAGTQSYAMINVNGTGTLTIVRAPMGALAETSGQRGDLILRGTDGATVTLHLDSNSVS